MKPARFFFMDARAAIPFVFTLLHLRWYTLVGAAVTTLLFYFLEQRGMSFDAALRGMRVWFVSRKRPNIKHCDRHRMVDYAWEPWPEKFNDKPLDDSESVTPDPQKTSMKTERTSAKPSATPSRKAPPKSGAKTAAPAAPGKSG
jgi:hypothetical protein